MPHFENIPYDPITSLLPRISIHIYHLPNFVYSDSFILKMWGNSPPLDFQEEFYSLNNQKDDSESLQFLTVGAVDARHIIKTLASSYLHPNRVIKFHAIEASLEHVARSILLLNICLQKDLGLQEASRYYLEILGNTLLTPGTAKYLTQIINRLIDVATQTIPCPWLNLESLKYKDRDFVEGIFKFWIRAICEGVPLVEYWDRRVRKALGTRYDYRDGVFDWDFHMVLHSRNLPHLTLHEYKFWRNNGVAFTWLEAEPARSNPTLISNIIAYGKGFIHYAYLGDITNGPFLTWAIDEAEEKSKLRATDKAEKQIIKSIYQIRTNTLCPDEVIAAHRDQSVLDGVLVTEMPDDGIEQEVWVVKKQNKKPEDSDCWIDVPSFKVNFHTASSCVRYKNKNEWKESINIIFIAHNLINHIQNIASLLKKDGMLIVETQKYLVEARKEEQNKFTEELKKITSDSNFKLIEPFDPYQDNFARFYKEDTNHN